MARCGVKACTEWKLISLVRGSVDCEQLAAGSKFVTQRAIVRVAHVLSQSGKVPENNYTKHAPRGVDK